MYDIMDLSFDKVYKVRLNLARILVNIRYTIDVDDEDEENFE